MLKIIAACGLLAIIVSVIYMHVMKRDEDEGWNYLHWPSVNGQYRIRLESGWELKAHYQDGKWCDSDNVTIDPYSIDCWKPIAH